MIFTHHYSQLIWHCGREVVFSDNTSSRQVISIYARILTIDYFATHCTRYFVFMHLLMYLLVVFVLLEMLH